MINSTSLNEVHNTLLKQYYPRIQPASKTNVFFGPRSKNVSSSAKQIGTPVLPTHQDEVRHRQGRHGKLTSPSTTNSSGRAGIPNHPRHQKVSSSKLAGNRHSLGRRHIGTLGPHHLGCFLCHDCPNNRCRTNNLDNTTGPRAGTIKYGWNSGSNQLRLPLLGGGCSDLPNMHLRATGIEEAHHQCV
jgi:hypothetical protein